MRSSLLLVLAAALPTFAACESTSGPDRVDDASTETIGHFDSGSDADAIALDGAVDGDAALADASPQVDGSMPDDAASPADGAAGDAGDAEQPDASGPRPPLAAVPARIAAPCTAALPTGWCLVSEQGHFVGQGRSDAAGGVGSVTVRDHFPLHGQGVSLQQTKAFRDMSVVMEPIRGQSLKPGLYTPVGWIANEAGEAVLDVAGDGRGCSHSAGRFAIDELELSAVGGIARLSATFEHSCGGGPMMRGVVHFNATGQGQASAVAGPRITLPGTLQGLVYDAASHAVFGWDAVSRVLVRVALGSGQVTTIAVAEVPAGACIDGARQLLVVAHRAPLGLGEYRLDTLERVRSLTWIDFNHMSTAPTPMLCGKDRVLFTMGGSATELTIARSLAGAAPSFDTLVNITKIGPLASDAAELRLFVLRAEDSFTAGLGSLSRLDPQTFFTRDVSSQDPARALDHDPIAAPLLYDEQHGIIAARNRVLDAADLTKVLRSFPSYRLPGSPLEFATAIDAKHGLLATNHFIYTVPELTLYTTTLRSEAPLRFFDRDGVLWHLLPDESVLAAQQVLP